MENAGIVPATIPGRAQKKPLKAKNSLRALPPRPIQPDTCAVHPCGLIVSKSLTLKAGMKKDRGGRKKLVW
jgi:hypothetical protein